MHTKDSRSYQTPLQAPVSIRQYVRRGGSASALSVHADDGRGESHAGLSPTGLYEDIRGDGYESSDYLATFERLC